MKRMGSKESVAITYIRTCAMMLIVMCHIAQCWLSSPVLGQVFNVGVPIFFLISGYLYGQKQIDEKWTWVAKQLVKIILPLYIFYAIGYIVMSPSELHWMEVVKLLLCVQGLFGGSLGVVNVGHLWFISYILICYLITPGLQWMRDHWDVQKRWTFVLLIAIAQIVFILSIEPIHAMVNTNGIVLYIFAYFLSAIWEKRLKKGAMCVLTLFMIGCIAVRLSVKYYADMHGGSAGVIYDRVVAGYCHIVLACWICAVIYKFVFSFDALSNKVYPVVNFVSNYSYEVYIVHMMFLTGYFNIRNQNRSVIFDLIIYSVITLLAAMLLHKMTALIRRIFT